MGACLSCLGIGQSSSDAERSRLLYPDDPYSQNANGYGTYSGTAPNGIPPQNVMSQEEVRREQEALDNITRWASDQVVEIFPHQQRGGPTAATSQAGPTENATSSSMHHDILLSMIPGDKSKKSIRIYPASRPTSEASMRSKASSKRMHSSARKRDSSVFVKLTIDPT